MAAVAVTTTAVALTVAFGFFIARQWRIEREAMVEHGAVLASVMAANASSAVILHDPATAEDILDSSRAVPHVRAAYIFDAGGRVFAHEGTHEHVAVREQAAPAWTFDRDTLTVQVPVRVDQERVGELVLVAGLEGLHRTFLGYAVFAGLLFVGVLGPVLWAALWLARRVIRPVDRLSDAMADVRRSGEFSRIVERAPDSELARLTDEFNALLAELARRDADLRELMATLVTARDQADAANQLKSEFLANMSHEIRTPLNGVLGMASVMAFDELSDAQRERLQIIQRSGSGLLAILNDILDIAKVEAGELELELAEFQIHEVVRDTCAAFQGLAEQKDLSLDVTVAPEAEGTWLGDAARLRQIVVNLVSNAVKFTDQGGVRVEVALEHGATGALTLAVTDTGIGVPAEKLPLLFEKFTQADASTTRQFGGTGLGLSIALQLAKLMGGTMTVDSREGTGSTFRVRLPLQRVAGPAPRPAAEPSEITPSALPGRRVHALAAEDNPTNRLIIKALLELGGVEIELVEDGRAAVEAWSRGAFDLVLMDVQMPVMDGISATRAIRRLEAERGLARTPIIALTANVMTHQIEEYLAAGMDGCVAKPIEAATLYGEVNAVLATADEELARLSA